MFKKIFIILFFISISLSQNVIEGRWIPELFSNTMYIFEDGLRYTIYNTDSNFEDLDIEDAIPNPNPYYVDEDTIIIDLFFGNEATYTLGFRCDGNVVDFYYDDDETTSASCHFDRRCWWRRLQWRRQWRRRRD